MYEGCIVGRHPRSSFPKEATFRAKNPLQLIHADIFGPIDPISCGKTDIFLLSLMTIVERCGYTF